MVVRVRGEECLFKEGERRKACAFNSQRSLWVGVAKEREGGGRRFRLSLREKGGGEIESGKGHRKNGERGLPTFMSATKGRTEPSRGSSFSHKSLSICKKGKKGGQSVSTVRRRGGEGEKSERQNKRVHPPLLSSLTGRCTKLLLLSLLWCRKRGKGKGEEGGPSARVQDSFRKARNM